jgi:hypothetical protein
LVEDQRVTPAKRAYTAHPTARGVAPEPRKDPRNERHRHSRRYARISREITSDQPLTKNPLPVA